MAACNCEGCGGHGEYVEAKRREAERKRLDFEAWLVAGKPEGWHQMTPEQKTALAVEGMAKEAVPA